ncbi:transposable element Tcb1 transposase [Trichonephila clavipes]|nr:transposable element Tcb1 transposase [Trichonephila clavipes]
MLNSCVMYCSTPDPAPGIMVWDGIGYHSRTPLVRIVDTLNSQRYIFEVFGASCPSLLSGLGHSHISDRIMVTTRGQTLFKRFFVNRQIELLHSRLALPIFR